MSPSHEMSHLSAFGYIEARLHVVNQFEIRIVRSSREDAVDECVNNSLIVIGIDSTSVNSLFDESTNGDPWNLSRIYSRSTL